MLRNECLAVSASEVEGRLHAVGARVVPLRNGCGLRWPDVGAAGSPRQRLACARAFVSQSPFVILDEPLASLDQANSDEVAEAIVRLTSGRTTFLITHDPAHASLCDRVLVLDKGRVYVSHGVRNAVAG